MSNHSVSIRKRIDALDDKQAIHIANSLVEAAFKTASTFTNLDDDALLIRVADEVQAFDRGDRMAKLRATPNWTERPLGGPAAGSLARRGLQMLAEQPGGDALVAKALDEFYDAQADFGVLSGAVAIGFLWLIFTGGVKFKIGTFEYVKEGWSADAQAKVAAEVIPDTASKILSGSGVQ